LHIQKEAYYAALMKAKAANGGELTYGMVISCAQSFENQGFGNIVNNRKLRYCVGREKLRGTAFDEAIPVARIQY
jgi:hypothetical protein